MTRSRERRKREHTKPDHRPMIPELRSPEDPLDLAVREARRRYDDVNPNSKQNWR